MEFRGFGGGTEPKPDLLQTPDKRGRIHGFVTFSTEPLNQVRILEFPTAPEHTTALHEDSTTNRSCSDCWSGPWGGHGPEVMLPPHSRRSAEEKRRSCPSCSSQRGYWCAPSGSGSAACGPDSGDHQAPPNRDVAQTTTVLVLPPEPEPR